MTGSASLWADLRKSKEESIKDLMSASKPDMPALIGFSPVCGTVLRCCDNTYRVCIAHDTFFVLDMPVEISLLRIVQECNFYEVQLACAFLLLAYWSLSYFSLPDLLALY